VPVRSLEAASSHHLVRQAALASMSAAALFATMAMGVRALAVRLPAAQVAAVRFGTGLLVVLALVALGRVRLRPRRWGWLLVRGLAGGLAVIAYFSCIPHVGVGVATLLNHTGPVWSLSFAWLLLGERPRRQSLMALALTLTGVVLVMGNAGSLQLGLWQALGVFSAVTSGLAVTSIRAARQAGRDGLPGESSWSVFGSFTGLGLLATLPAMGGQWVPPTAIEWGLLLFVAFTSIAAQLLMTHALAHVTAVASGIILQLTVVLALAGGVALFGESLSPAEIAGSLLTMAGVAWVVIGNHRDGDPQRVPKPPRALATAGKARLRQRVPAEAGGRPRPPGHPAGTALR
jgi:drug/metabolite transporter (DMT)-like permease